MISLGGKRGERNDFLISYSPSKLQISKVSLFSFQTSFQSLQKRETKKKPFVLVSISFEINLIKMTTRLNLIPFWRGSCEERSD